MVQRIYHLSLTDDEEDNDAFIDELRTVRLGFDGKIG